MYSGDLRRYKTQILFWQSMEDYQAAFIQRHIDTETLCKSTRKIAAMHFGGVTIECLLKSMIFAALPKGTSQEWKTDSNSPGATL